MLHFMKIVDITVVFSPAARSVRELALSVEHGSSVAACIQTSGLLEAMAAEEVDSLVVGVWGKKVSLDYLVHSGDRVELYRPLKVDPKVARRERFVRQGAKLAGLFAKRRSGAKAGY